MQLSRILYLATLDRYEDLAGGLAGDSDFDVAEVCKEASKRPLC